MCLSLALTGWVSTERNWHQDDYLNPPDVDAWYVAAWLALDDIPSGSGPFQYVPGSHRWPAIRGDKVRLGIEAQSPVDQARDHLPEEEDLLPDDPFAGVLPRVPDVTVTLAEI